MKFKIITYGCAANQADSNIMQALMNKEFEESDNPDLYIVNSCAVKSQTESKIIDFVKTLDKKVIIAGCLPKINLKRLEQEFPNHSFIGPE